MDRLRGLERELRELARKLAALGQHDHADRTMHLAALAVSKRLMLEKVERQLAC